MSRIGRQLVDVNAFFNTLYENLLEVSTEIYTKVKEAPSLYEQFELDLLGKFFCS